jgi:RES domain-containing protein
MKLFRIAKKPYCEDLSGHGAFLFGGRWNSKGTRMVYTSENISLCTLEALVHLNKRQLESSFALITIELPDDLGSFLTITTDQLPKGWNSPNDYRTYTRLRGDEFCRNKKHLALRVPSSIVEDQYNLLLNPLHPDMDAVRITSVKSYKFDKRLQDLVAALSFT